MDNETRLLDRMPDRSPKSHLREYRAYTHRIRNWERFCWRSVRWVAPVPQTCLMVHGFGKSVWMARRSLGRGVCSGAALALFTVLGYPRFALATTLEFESLAEIEAAGFTRVEGGTSSFAGGLLTVTGNSYEEWKLESGQGDWWQSTRLSGWVVEARIKIIDAPADCASTGFWVTGADGQVTKVQLSSSWAGISYPAPHGVDMDTTDDFHVYRLQYLGRDRYHFSVDGVLVADAHQLDSGAGSHVLMFGDLGGCTGATSEWDSFSYEPEGQPVLEGDADGDGVDNANDNCATDVNPDQADADADSDGNACDPCPNDADNDLDGDARCGDVDVCPEDPRNDEDADGVCDGEQCAPFEAALQLCSPGTCEADPQCPSVCNCEPPFVGMDPVGPSGLPIMDPVGPIGTPIMDPISTNEPPPSAEAPEPSPPQPTASAEPPPTIPSEPADAGASPDPEPMPAQELPASASEPEAMPRPAASDESGQGCATAPGTAGSKGWLGLLILAGMSCRRARRA